MCNVCKGLAPKHHMYIYFFTSTIYVRHMSVYVKHQNSKATKIYVLILVHVQNICALNASVYDGTKLPHVEKCMYIHVLLCN